MVHCCILGCKNRSERKAENVTFHSFPKNLVIRQMWIHSTGRQNWEPAKHTCICSRHFEENCFRKTQKNRILNISSVRTMHIIKAKVQPPLDIPSTTSSQAKDAETTSVVNRPPIEKPESIAFRNHRLIKQINEQTALAQMRKRKLAALKSKNRRLKIKNAKLSVILRNLRTQKFNTNCLKSNNTKFSPEDKILPLNMNFII